MLRLKKGILFDIKEREVCYLDSIYEEFEKLIKTKGKRLKASFSGIETESIWQIKNLLVAIDEFASLNENKIIAVIDIADKKFFYVIYISPLALKNGAKEFFRIIDDRISSMERLIKVFEKLKEGQPVSGFLFSFEKAVFLWNNEIIYEKILYHSGNAKSGEAKGKIN